ncbi:LuxR family transcriptional regulator, partial [Candidatus Gracilibacteria bacterium]|nr:LuxR family transcriptional regulator [Candidatus Gracilibacteria bacterium]
AVRLLGAAATLREQIGTPHLPTEIVDYERGLAALRHALDEQAFASAWQLGGSLPLEATIALVGQ